MSGTVSEVAGIISTTNNMKTVKARRLVMTSVRRSPDSGGKINDSRVKAVEKENSTSNN